MKTKIVEVTNGERNWGKFLLCQFDHDEWHYRSQISGAMMMRERGWTQDHLWVLDLQTGEGFCTHPHGSAHFDLENHKIWVCPLFEPFLDWLYTGFKKGLFGSPLDFAKIPAHLDLPTAPFEFFGHRRSGK